MCLRLEVPHVLSTTPIRGGPKRWCPFESTIGCFLVGGFPLLFFESTKEARSRCELTIFFEWLASEIIWNYDGLMLDTAILLFSSGSIQVKISSVSEVLGREYQNDEKELVQKPGRFLFSKR